MPEETAVSFLYLTEESRKLPMEAYPYAVQDLDGIDADYLEGVYRRWAKKAVGDPAHAPSDRAGADGGGSGQPV